MFLNYFSKLNLRCLLLVDFSVGCRKSFTAHWRTLQWKLYFIILKCTRLNLRVFDSNLKNMSWVSKWFEGMLCLAVELPKYTHTCCTWNFFLSLVTLLLDEYKYLFQPWLAKTVEISPIWILVLTPAELLWSRRCQCFQCQAWMYRQPSPAVRRCTEPWWSPCKQWDLGVRPGTHTNRHYSNLKVHYC
jgi:hypothetical protein